jgi:hypothetical protein
MNQERDELIEHLENTKHLHEAMGYTPMRAFKDGYDQAMQSEQVKRLANVTKDCSEFMMNLYTAGYYPKDRAADLIASLNKAVEPFKERNRDVTQLACIHGRSLHFPCDSCQNFVDAGNEG